MTQACARMTGPLPASYVGADSGGTMDTYTTCRNPLVAGAKFCGLCGTRTNIAAETSPPAAATSPAAAPDTAAQTVVRSSLVLPPNPGSVTPRAQPVPEAPPHSASAPPPMAPPSRPRTQVPAGVVAAGAAALVLVVGLVAGLVLLGQDDPPSRSVTEDTVAGSDSAPAPDAPAASPSATGEDVRCWNGDARPSVEECRPVSGVAGMRWAMPPFDRRFSQCDPASVYDGKVRAFGCTLTTKRGYKARVTFSEWSTYEAGDEHYLEKYGAPDRTDSQFNIWEPAYVTDNFQTSRMFSGGLPFSITVSSDEKEIAEAVMSGFFFRPDADVTPYLR